MGARDFGAVGVEEAQRGPGGVRGTSVLWLTSINSACDRVCSQSHTSRMERIRPTGQTDSVKLDEQFLGGASAENIFDHLVDFLLVVHPRPPLQDGRG